MNTAVTSPPPMPAGHACAASAAGWRQWLSRAGAGLLSALEAAGRARAQPYLLDFAARCEALQPELAKELRAASRHGPTA